MGRGRRPARCGHVGGHRRGRVHAPLQDHAGAGACGASHVGGLQERRVAALRATESAAARPMAPSSARRLGAARRDDRRHPLPRARGAGGSGHRRPGQQACSRVA